MYIPKKLTLKNLLSHKDTSFDFISGKATMISGENRDDDGQESNGSGKSAIIEGISLAITGSPFRKVKDCDLIYYGEESAEILIELFNPITNEELIIERNFYAKKSKSSTLECFINGESQDSVFPTVRDGNKWILDTIGLSREDIINYFIVSKSKSASFFGQSDNDKKKIVSRFSNTDSLLPIKDQVKKDVKDKVTELELERNKIERLEGKIEGIKEQIDIGVDQDPETVKKSKISLKKDQIKAVEEEVKNLKDSILEKELKLQGIESEIVDLELELNQLPQNNFDEEISQIEVLLQECAAKIDAQKSKSINLLNEKNEAISLKSSLEAKIASSIQCPHCEGHFILKDKDFNIEEAKETIELTNTLIQSNQEEINSIDNSIKEIEEEEDSIKEVKKDIKQQIDAQEQQVAKIKTKISTKKSDFEIHQKSVITSNVSIESLNKKIESLQDDIEVIKQEKIEDPLKPLKDKLKEEESILSDLNENYENENKILESLQSFEVIFNKFIAHLSNKAVKSIQHKTNDYLCKMNSNLSIDIEGYKVKADGSIKEQFTTIVSRNGIRESFFENYSEGEQSRINIACTLALNSLLNNACEEGKGLSLVILDELMGSLDSLGVGLVMNALNQLDQTIISISHVEPKFPYEETIKIVKENGESKIVSNE